MASALFGKKKKKAAAAEAAPTSGPIVKPLDAADPLAERARKGRSSKPGLQPFADLYRSTILAQNRSDRFGAIGKLGA